MRNARIPITPPMILFLLTMSLTAIGVTAVYSASSSTFHLTRQILFAGLGVMTLGVFYNLDYHVLRKLAIPGLLLALGLCIGVFAGDEIRGARRWIQVGRLRVQPSELAKLALIIYMARMLTERRAYIRSFLLCVLPAMLVTGLFAVLIVLEPDYSAAFVLCAIIFGMWLAAEMSWWHLSGLVMVSLPAGIIFFLSEPYRWRRLLAFIRILLGLEDRQLLQGWGYHLHQSLISIGSGGLWGRGLGESHQKFKFLSEAHTDFIFSIICEETGFIAGTLVIVLFAGITFLGWRVAMEATDNFGCLLATGITLMFFVSAAINLSVTLGLLPTTGLVLPFISAGGSAMIVSMAAMGILMNIARKQYEQRIPG